MVIPPDGAGAARPTTKRRIGAKPGSRRRPRVAPPLPRLTPEETEAAIEILPPDERQLGTTDPRRPAFRWYVRMTGQAALRRPGLSGLARPRIAAGS